MFVINTGNNINININDSNKTEHKLNKTHTDETVMNLVNIIVITVVSGVITWVDYFTSNNTSWKADTALHIARGGTRSKFPLTSLDRYLGNFHLAENHISQQALRH